MIFGIPIFEGIFETLPKRKSRQIIFWEFLTFSGIPKLGGNFQKFILAVDCFGAVSSFFRNFWKISTSSWGPHSIAFPIEGFLEDLQGSTQSIQSAQSVRTGRTGRSLSVSFLKESDQRLPLLFFCLFACECVQLRVIVFEFVKKVEMIIEHSLSDLFYFSKFLLLSLPLSECTSLFTTFGNRVLHFALPTLTKPSKSDFFTTPQNSTFDFLWVPLNSTTHLHPFAPSHLNTCVHSCMHMCAHVCTCVHNHSLFPPNTFQIIPNRSTTLHNPPTSPNTPYRCLRLRRVCAVVTALIRWSLPLAVFNPHATPFSCGGCGWTLVWRFCQVPKSLLPFPRGVHLCNQNWILRGGKIHPRKNYFSTSPKSQPGLNTPPKRVFSTHTFPPENTPKIRENPINSPS